MIKGMLAASIMHHEKNEHELILRFSFHASEGLKRAINLFLVDIFLRSGIRVRHEISCFA